MRGERFIGGAVLTGVVLSLASTVEGIGPRWAELEVASVIGSMADLGRKPFTLDLTAGTAVIVDSPPASPAWLDHPARAPGRLRLGPTVDLSLARAGDLLTPRGQPGDWDGWIRAARERDAAPFVARLSLRF